MNRTCTWPLLVRASLGSIRPIVLVNDTTVPFWTGVPAPGDDVAVVVAGVLAPVVGVVAVVPFSITVATISTSPLRGTLVAAGISEMTLPVGARSGTLSHPETSET